MGKGAGERGTLWKGRTPPGATSFGMSGRGAQAEGWVAEQQQSREKRGCPQALGFPHRFGRFSLLLWFPGGNIGGGARRWHIHGEHVHPHLQATLQGRRGAVSSPDPSLLPDPITSPTSFSVGQNGALPIPCCGGYGAPRGPRDLGLCSEDLLDARLVGVEQRARLHVLGDQLAACPWDVLPVAQDSQGQVFVRLLLLACEGRRKANNPLSLSQKDPSSSWHPNWACSFWPCCRHLCEMCSSDSGQYGTMLGLHGVMAVTFCLTYPVYKGI